jgi:hypothetical protein
MGSKVNVCAPLERWSLHMNAITSRTPCITRSTAWAAAALLATTLLGGCAALRTISSEVSTYGTWPADRTAGSFVIERLPSQQAQAAQQEPLEEGARQALQSAGFVPALAGAAPDVVVQIGARVSRQERSPWDDPFWWRPYGSTRWFVAGWPAPYWSLRMYADRTEYQREVGVLIRDRASGEPLYEARARNDGITNGGTPMMAAMFAAALKEFPKVQNEPHDVAVMLP